jgi:hypothetical protein
MKIIAKLPFLTGESSLLVEENSHAQLQSKEPHILSIANKFINCLMPQCGIKVYI